MIAQLIHSAPRLLLALRTDRRAVTALEYGLIAGVLGVAIITAFTSLGTTLTNEFTKLAASMKG